MSLDITKNQDVLLRGTSQHQTTRELRNLLFEGASYKLFGTGMAEQFGGTSPAPVTRPGVGLLLTSWEIHNRSSAAMTVGIGFRWRTEVYQIGDFDADGTPNFTRIPNYKSRNEVVWAADFAEANGDSLMVFSQRPWDWISLNVTQASTGNVTTTLDYTTVSGVGSGAVNAWTDVNSQMPLRDDLTLSAANYATGEDVFVWNPPHDWAKTTINHGLGDGIPTGQYGFRLIFDGVAGTNDPGWTGIEVGSMVFSGEELADNGLFENENAGFGDLDADGVVMFLETLTNVGSMVRFGVTHIG